MLQIVKWIIACWTLKSVAIYLQQLFFYFFNKVYIIMCLFLHSKTQPKTKKHCFLVKIYIIHMDASVPTWIKGSFTSKSLTIYQQLWSLMLLCKILCHYKFLTPSTSMPQKSNHSFKENYSYIQAGTFEPMCIKDLKTECFCHISAIQNTNKTHNDMEIGKEVKTIIVVDTSLHSLKSWLHVWGIDLLGIIICTYKNGFIINLDIWRLWK